jgi:hypothetical protein
VAFALAGCTHQPMADIAPYVAMSCDASPPMAIEALWNEYLQNAPASGLGGCAFQSCHGGVAGGAGNLHFSDPDSFVAATVGVKAPLEPDMMLVRRGDPMMSYLYQRLLPEAAAGRMPPDGPYLDEEGLGAVVGWICSTP